MRNRISGSSAVHFVKRFVKLSHERPGINILSLLLTFEGFTDILGNSDPSFFVIREFRIYFDLQNS